MSRGYSIKADNKPTLFTWDIETEYQNIDRQLTTHRTADLEITRGQLRQLKLDFHDIILTKEISEEQIERIFELVRQNKSGIWEGAINTITRLAFHFEQVRKRLLTDLTDNQAKYIANLVTAIDEFWDFGQLRDILLKLLASKNNKVRERTLTKIFELRLSALKDDLVKMKETETSGQLLEQIDFTLKYIDTPKGNLIVSR